MAKIIGIIPARYSSTRFPGKPLIDIGGKSMIQRVYEQASQAGLEKIYVATDDERIAEHVNNFGGHVMLTSPDHRSGTDRCAEVQEKLGGETDVVINIQGDEPFIDPEQIRLVAQCFEKKDTQIATLMKKLELEEDIRNPNIVKVVFNEALEAIYFSRSAIPYRRSPEADVFYYKHLGIYGYSGFILREIAALPPGKLEIAESLEQLRWLEAGYTIRLAETTIETIGIDTPDDLLRVEKMMKS